MNKVNNLVAEQLKTDRPDFKPGDTVAVDVKVIEGQKERIQVFEGNVIARTGKGINATFTVRKISNGVGVERIFPLHAPTVAEIKVLRRGKVRRAKLVKKPGSKNYAHSDHTGFLIFIKGLAIGQPFLLPPFLPMRHKILSGNLSKFAAHYKML